MKELLYGAAYYDEYMPYDRLEKDVAMMKKAGINTVRIAESTWSTCEPQEGIFDFSHVTRVMDAMEEAGINVIIGTPTYAVPTWMVKAYPDVLAETVKGRGIYGARQIMDITHPVYRYYAERVIRKLMEVSAHRKCVIGFQLDNETKYYGTAGKNVQLGFVKYLREKFNNDLDALNHEFGLDYWSNRINVWEDFPDMRGTINGSLGAEFEKYQRSLVEEFLGWQAEIVSEYKREDQFITHNLDFEWRGYSYGVQPDVDHFKCAKHLTLAGVDIYHPTQDALTGAEIAFGGDLIRTLKNDNYLVLETEAQGYPGWTPYDGQLRLQAYSHLAAGALGVMYWHWHSIHNSFETYWRGLLSHDLEENAVYREACIIGSEFKKLSSILSGLKKNNKVAIMVNNESLTALKWFGIEADAAGNNGIRYNDVVRWIYDALYKMNIECDIIYSESTDIEKYKAVILPAMYVADEKLLKRLKDYTMHGGTLIATFKTAFANENVGLQSVACQAATLERVIKNAEGEDVGTLIADIPEGTFLASSSDANIQMDVQADAGADGVLDRVQQQLETNGEAGYTLNNYVMADVTFYVNGEKQVPQQPITFTVKGTNLDSQKAVAFSDDGQNNPTFPDVTEVTAEDGSKVLQFTADMDSETSVFGVTEALQDKEWSTQVGNATVKVTGTEEPDPELVQKYEERYQEFKKLYPALKGIYQGKQA